MLLAIVMVVGDRCGCPCYPVCNCCAIVTIVVVVAIVWLLLCCCRRRPLLCVVVVVVVVLLLLLLLLCHFYATKKREGICGGEETLGVPAEELARLWACWHDFGRACGRFGIPTAMCQ